ncbi:MAG: hypothetical protein P8Y92_05970 [Halioglobus sp.]|jgi:hypothetical protein
MNDNTLLDENFPSCLRAVFASKEAVRETLEALERAVSLDSGQIRVIPPGGAEASVSAPAGAVGYSLKIVLLGAMLGGALGATLAGADSRNLSSQGWITMISCGALGAALAYCLAWLISWRKRHSAPLVASHSIAAERGYTLEIEVRDLPQQYAVRQALTNLGVSFRHAGDAGSCGPHEAQ